MSRRARRRGDSWRPGERVDVHAEMGALALEVVGEALFGVELADETARLWRTLNSVIESFAAQAGPFGRLGSIGSDPIEAHDPIFESMVREIIENHSGRSDRGDMVSALLNATDDEGDGSRLAPDEVRDHVVTLLIAGHETTANALTWTFHLLGTNPGIALRLHEELAALQGRSPSVDDLSALVYTRAVVKEAMRLYPPAWAFGRTVTRPFALGGWDLEPDTTVLVSPWVQHRRAEWFPEPERFDPGRWLDERAECVPRHAYLPFGLGSRSCIGEQFAWAELVSILAVLAGAWRFEPTPGHVVEPRYRVTLRPHGGLPMIAQRF